MKLWEVLKALDENPEKEFKCGGVRLICEFGTYRFTNVTTQERAFYMGADNDWQEVKQPVTWQEAIEAWTNGKTIRCEDGGFDCLFSGGKSVLTDSVGPIDKYQITKGTWYIED